eukprot:4657726-Pleurochrysis_carterae.AAC.2
MELGYSLPKGQTISLQAAVSHYTGHWWCNKSAANAAARRAQSTSLLAERSRRSCSQSAADAAGSRVAR